MHRIVTLSVTLLLAGSSTALAQWTNRYPKVDGYRHHVYLEGFELPILAAGPTDPAPSPDGKTLAIAARGWLWLLDLESGVARRLTRGGAMDSRPSWSADGARIAFLRDDTSDVDIWVVDTATGEPTPLVETAALELDPAYSADGELLYYSSAEAGDLDVWRLQIGTGERMRVTSRSGIEVRPLPLPDGDSLLFLSKGGGGPDRLVHASLETDTDRTLRAQSIASQTHPGLSPDGRTLAVNWPGAEGYDLYLVDLDDEDAIRLNERPRLPLAPAFSPDGDTVYFAEANEDLQFELFAVPTRGGRAKRVPIRSWDWGEPTGRLEIRTTRSGSAAPLPSRLHVVDGSGHPAVPSSGMPRFDMTHGKVYFYSPGVVSVPVPAGEVRVEAAHGFSSPSVSRTVEVAAGTTQVVELSFDALWEPRADGWYSADHHYHMNYGGPYRLTPEDLLLALEAEDVDVGTPLMANLHHRFNDLEFFDYRRLSELPFLTFGQEVRSHFLGHLGLIAIEEPHWPWYWGPGYPVYGEDDRPNHDVLRFARRQGGVTSYMHPVSRAEPFADEEAMRSIPINLIPDAVLGDLDTLELACLWISELGTHDVWYRFLNVGSTVAASAGTDIMADYYRTMAVGATRIYVRVEAPMTFERYLEALRGGRSFVSTGPLLDFRVADRGPGAVVENAGGETSWSLRLSTPVPVDAVEILVNGEVVHAEAGLPGPGEKRFTGAVSLPAGGWIAARAHGGEELWPAMNGYPFAHTSPIWIGERGSTEPEAARRAARELLAALDVAERRLDEGYGEAPVPRLKARFRDAREHLESFVETTGRAARANVPRRPVHTYSIVARDPDTGALGVAVQSHWFSVGSNVTWAEAGVGAVATQSFIDPAYGKLGLDLMRAGKSAGEALDGLVAADEGRDFRQVAMVDASGRVAAWTGDKDIAAAGHHTGKGYSVQANLMLSDEVWPAMARAYESAEGDLAERLLKALEAAEAAGGDIRGRQSAALLIVAAESTGQSWRDRLFDLRIEDHPEPLVELRRLVTLQRAYHHMNAGDAALESGDREAALREYGDARKLVPDSVEMIYWNAVALVNMGRLDEALPMFRRTFAEDENWATLTPRLPASGLLPDDPALIERILRERDER